MKASDRFRPAALVLSAALLGLLGGVPAARGSAESPTLSELFQKAKTEFRIASYKSSLDTFAVLEKASLEPGNEASREKLAPIISFYRAANLAALGRAEEAKKEFESYLESSPNTRLDPGTFPRPVLEAFQRAKESVALRNPKTEESAGRPDESGIEAAYRKFRPDPSLAPIGVEPGSEAALRFIMTSREKDAWMRVSDSQEKAEFLTQFWRRRDPSPTTPENEFREEIERRIRFADSRFAQEEHRGSESDRGMVFVLMGPPSYIGQKPFKTEDDPLQIARNAPIRETTRNADGSTSTILVPRTALTAQTLQGTREIWYYRRDRLPKQVRFTEVDFEFLTRKGIGTAVLQRDHEILTTLDQVARAALPTNTD
ncbi:MAG: GWxTD domain-containing protein [Acidobacteriota bacterium]